MSDYLSPSPFLQFFDLNGNFLSGGKLFTYLNNTNTKAATYTDASGGTPNTNPVILDAYGSANVWLPQGSIYTYVLSPSSDTDPPTNPIRTINGVSAGGQLLTSALIGPLLYPILAAEGSSVVNSWYPYGDIRRYGASSGAADNAPYIRNALATALDIIIPDETYLVGSPIVQTVAGQYFAWYGTLKANGTWASAAQTPTLYNNITIASAPLSNAVVSLNSNGAVNNFIFSHNGTGSIIDSFSPLMCDGAGVADGYQAEGQSSGGQTILRSWPTIKHTPNCAYAFTSAYQGDSVIVAPQGEQWDVSDTQWQTQSNFTGIGIFFGRADCKADDGIPRWFKRRYVFGQYSASSGVNGAHPYGGAFAGNSWGAPAWADSINVEVQEGSSGCWFDNAYFDQGHCDLYTSDFRLTVKLPLQSSSSTNFSQDPGQVTPNLIRSIASGKGFPYDLQVRMPNKYLATQNLNVNTANGNNLPTSPIGFYPSSPTGITTLTSNGTTGTLTYPATGGFPPQVNSSFFIDSATSASFNNSVTAGAFVNGNLYKITSVGSTDFTLVGAAINAVGHIFTANGAGSGTGTAAQAYTVATGTQAGGLGSTVTVTFLCSVNATASVPGTITRSWSGNMNGLDVQSAGVLSSIGNESLEVASGRVFLATSSSHPSDVLWSATNLVTERRQAGNFFPNNWQYGNHSGQYPYVNLTTGYLALIAANATGGRYPAVNLALNITGTNIADDGSANGVMQLQTQNANRVSLDGFSGGVQSLYPNTDNYMNLGYTAGGNHRFATVYAATGAINTSDGREKTDIEDADLGLGFILKLRPVKYRWKVGGNHVQHGHYVFTATGAPAPEGYSPAANHNRQEQLRAVIAKIPEDREKLTAEQRQQLDEATAELNALVTLAQSISRTPEIVTPIPGKRTHYGLIAQEAKAALDAHGIKDHAGFVLADPKDPESQQSLRYDELTIPALIKAVQELAAKVAALEAKG